MNVGDDLYVIKTSYLPYCDSNAKQLFSHLGLSDRHRGLFTLKPPQDHELLSMLFIWQIRAGPFFHFTLVRYGYLAPSLQNFSKKGPLDTFCIVP
jgi:hypothetical protein